MGYTKEMFFCEMQKTKEGLEYLRIIQDAKDRPIKRRKGFERHHIFPKGLGGTNEDGLVNLTVFEHVKVHYLLALATQNDSMFRAMKIISGSRLKKLTDLEKVTLEDLEHWAEIRQKALNTPCSPEGCKKISEKAIVRWKRFRESGRIEEVRKNISKKTKEGMSKPESLQKLRVNLGSKWYHNRLTGEDMHWYLGMEEPGEEWIPGRRPMSQEARKKLSSSQKGLLVFYHNDELRINKKFPKGTIKEGWSLGRKSEYLGNRREYEILKRTEKYENLGAPDRLIKKHEN